MARRGRENSASPHRRSLRNLTPIKFLQINRWPYAFVSMLAAELSRTISEPQISRDIPMATCKRTQHFIRLTACRWRLRTHIGDLGEFGHDLTPLAGVGMVAREEIDPTLTGGRIMEKALDEVEEKFLDARRVGDGISRKRVEAMTAAADTHGERGAVEDESDGWDTALRSQVGPDGVCKRNFTRSGDSKENGWVMRASESVIVEIWGWEAVIATEIMTSLSGGTSLSINPVFFISIKLEWILCFDNKQGFIRVYVMREELDTIKNDKKMSYREG